MACTGDVDRPATANGCCGLHHEQWFSGAAHTRTCPFSFGHLWLMRSGAHDLGGGGTEDDVLGL
eukprot:COSAG01_NODE_3775_length_5710_cov_6.461059_8_plen_64_part_00